MNLFVAPRVGAVIRGVACAPHGVRCLGQLPSARLLPEAPVRVALRSQRGFSAPAGASRGSGLVASEQEDVDLDSLAYGFMGSQALFSALELGIFDHIAAKGPLTAEELKELCGIDAPRMQTLLTALVSVRCLRLDASTGAYANSPNVARFMVSSARAYYGDYFKLQIGRLFYHRMGRLGNMMRGDEPLDYADWFSDPEVASTYTSAQHNGSVATAKGLWKRLDSTSVTRMLDVGGGSGAFSFVFARKKEDLKSTVLEFPNVVATGKRFLAKEPAAVQERVGFEELDARKPSWPVPPGAYDLVLMSYISGSVPAGLLPQLYGNALTALRPGGRLVVHDFMVNDSLDGPPLGALWALQHVTVNPEGLGLCPANVSEVMTGAGFARTESMEMIHNMTKVVVGYKAE